MEAIDWYNLNANRNYPFAEESDRTATGGFVLPNDFVVDLSLLVKAGAPGDPIFLGQLGVTVYSYNLVFYRGTTAVAYVMIPRASIAGYSDFELIPINGQACGRVVVQEPSAALSGGVYQFATMFVEPRALRTTKGPKVQKIIQYTGVAELTGLVNLTYDPAVLNVEVSGTAIDPVLTFSLTQPNAPAEIPSAASTRWWWEIPPTKSYFWEMMLSRLNTF
jgi:hypothetical protein